jgi:phenylacetate-CoA ligase
VIAYDAAAETSTPAAIRAAQLEKLAIVLESARRNPFYGDLWRSAGADPGPIASVADFAKRYPPVTKAHFIADQDAAPPFGSRFVPELNADSPLSICTTSGTSGKGHEVHVLSRSEQSSSARPLAFAWTWAGLKPGQTFFVMLPVNMLAGGRLSYDMATEFGFTVFPLGSYDAHEKLELLRAFPVDAATSNASYFMRLADLAGDDVPRVPVLHLQGEGLSAAKVEELEEVWRARVMYSYGSTQAMTDHMCTCEVGVGTTDRPGLLHNIDTDWLLEVVDPGSGLNVADGERGEIVVTSLTRTRNPLIRCRTEDLGVFHEAAYCSCGRPFTGVEVGSITRAANVAKVKGINVWFDAVESTVFRCDAVRDFQAVIDRDASSRDRITVRASVDPGTPGAVGDELRTAIGISFDVELVQHEPATGDAAKAKRWVDLRQEG